MLPRFNRFDIIEAHHVFAAEYTVSADARPVTVDAQGNAVDIGPSDLHPRDLSRTRTVLWRLPKGPFLDDTRCSLRPRRLIDLEESMLTSNGKSILEALIRRYWFNL